MNVTKTTITTTVNVQVDLEARYGEELRPGYKSGAFLPDHLSLVWHRQDGGGWSLTTAKVAGPMLKKDGTPGQNRGDRRLTDYGGGLVDDTPDWVRHLVKEHQP